MVSFTYYPVSGTPIFQREHWVSDIQRIFRGPGHAFELRVPGLGSMICDADSTSTYSFSCEDWTLEAKTAGRQSWSPTQDTPEGWIVRLPLPLHWHVHSLASPCTFKLSIPLLDPPRAEAFSHAMVHQEKNWAASFPSAHMWLQARAGERGVCLAGGKILGMTAYMLGYRSPGLDVDFVPPFALSIFGLSPCMSVRIDWENREFDISVCSFWKKIALRAKAPKEKGWFGLSCPFPEGFRANFLTENFLAEVEVEVYERGWWGWKEVRRDRFEGASLEFGGDYFPLRGLKRE